MRSTRLPPLGELEMGVLEHLWSEGPGDVKAVHRAIGARRRITPNTVQSAMERLYRKGLLERDKVSSCGLSSGAPWFGGAIAHVGVWRVA